MVHCEKGHENPDGALFCKECGIQLLQEGNASELSFKRTFRKLHLVATISFYVMLVAVPLFLLSLILSNHYTHKKWDAEEVYENKLSNIINAVTYVDGLSNNKVEEIKQELYNRWENTGNLGQYYPDYEGEEKFIKQISANDMKLLYELRDKFNLYDDLVDYYFDIEYPGVIAILSLIASIAGVLSFPVFFCVFNLRWKKFELQLPATEAKKALKQYAFSLNTSGESIRIKENANGELRLHDKDNGRRAHYHLVQDGNGNAELIGEKYNTQNLIRTVFGKDINFIEK